MNHHPDLKINKYNNEGQAWPAEKVVDNASKTTAGGEDEPEETKNEILFINDGIDEKIKKKETSCPQEVGWGPPELWSKSVNSIFKVGVVAGVYHSEEGWHCHQPKCGVQDEGNFDLLPFCDMENITKEESHDVAVASAAPRGIVRSNKMHPTLSPGFEFDIFPYVLRIEEV